MKRMSRFKCRDVKMKAGVSIVCCLLYEKGGKTGA